MTHAVVVTSGGMDSTTAVYWAREMFDSIECLSFDYGQRHRKELHCARQIADLLNVDHTIVDMTAVNKLIPTSALTNEDIEVPEGHYAEETMKITVVPNRNAMMINIAAARAISAKASAIVVGVHAGDHVVYPDCRPEFIEQQERTLLIANEGFIDPAFRIHAPFVNLTKAQIASIGHDLSVPWHMTWTCYKGGDIHCGRCSTCVERLEAFHIAEVPETTPYMDRNYWRGAVNG